MNQELKDRIRKIQELINRGATKGEQVAAQKALDRLVKKYKLKDADLFINEVQGYSLSCPTGLEFKLLNVLVAFFELPLHEGTHYYKKSAKLYMTKLDWITLEGSYGYFRRHMMKQWRTHCLPLVNKCRKSRTRRWRRATLEKNLFSQYVIKSELYKQGETTQIDLESLSQEEIKNLMSLANVQGGKYKLQVAGGLMLEA